MTEASIVPTAAAHAWQALARALAGIDPPCRTDPDCWYEGAVATAIAGCLSCPARGPCLTFALAADERFGVWGGTDFARRPRHHRTTEEIA